MPSLDFTIALIPLAPFIAAFLAPSVFRFAGHYSGWLLGIIPASIFIYLLGFIEPIANHSFVFASLEWIPNHNLILSFFIDGLSLTFALLISGIGTFIIIYTGAYLKGHPHQGRFFSFMLMFMGSMLGLVLADNMIALFAFWELTSITSFLLIGFDHSRQASRRAAIQALVITGGGGLALLAGMVLLQQVTGFWGLSEIRGFGAVTEQPEYLAILLLFILGAFTKSAQFPFHIWLPNAMEAPTPVSAFLHSATMVKAGIYLLARMFPTLGGTTPWTMILVVFGGITLLWGAQNALRQTDLKQMLAQTTVASLGLLVLLIGIGTETSIIAAVLYLVAHAFYKGALFLVAGIIDHGTGTRDITELGGLRGKMPITFLAAALAAFSMAGLPASIGFLAKEEMYAALVSPQWQNYVVLVVLIAGNAMMFAVAAKIAIKPFFGPVLKTPKHAHEGSFAMWIGPLILGGLAIAAGVMTGYVGHTFLVPTASAIYNFEVDSHLALVIDPMQPAFWLSATTWLLGLWFLMRLNSIRGLLRRLETAFNWSFDKGFDDLMFGLIRLSDAVTRFWHHGRLELYLIVAFVLFAVALYVPLLLIDGLPKFPGMPQLHFYEWAIMVMAVAGLAAVLFAQQRLIAIVSLGIQGFAVALIFMLLGAPDLSFTQFMVETLSVVIIALVMTRLHLEQRDRRVFEELLRDGTLAVVVGFGVSMFMIAVLANPLDTRLSDFFAATSVPIAHGHNIVNVILVDYRGLDTLGEISVVMAAGIAILALIRIRTGGAQTGIGADRKAKRRKAATKTRSKGTTQVADNTKSAPRKPRAKAGVPT